MRKYIPQVMEEINADPSTIAKYKDDAAIRLIFEYAFDPEKKMLLPEDAPPFKAAAEPLGMTPTNLYNELRRLYVFCRADLKPIKRESLFVSMLEGVHPTEAKMLIAVKDQNLHKLYPKITRKVAEGVGFVAPLAKKETTKKSVAGADQ
jgi:hypothetical protein